jgi:hypothetical protein
VHFGDSKRGNSFHTLSHHRPDDCLGVASFVFPSGLAANAKVTEAPADEPGPPEG